MRSVALTACLLAVGTAGLLWFLSGATRGGEARTSALEAKVAAPVRGEAPRQAEVETRRAGTTGPERRSVGAAVPLEAPVGLDAEVDPGPMRGFLVIDVDERAGGSPRPDVRLVLRPERSAEGEVLVYGAAARGTLEDALLSDFLGQAVFEVPAGVPLRLFAWDEATGLGQREVEVPRLASSERRELHINWQRQAPALLFGRIVAAGTWEPVAGASVSLRSSAGVLNQSTSALDGSFQLVVAEHLKPYVRIDKPGFTPAWRSLAAPGPGEVGTRERPVEIRLNRTATVEVTVVGRDLRPARNVELEIRMDPAHLEAILGKRMDPEREELRSPRMTDEAGLARFEELPAGVPLRLAIVAPSHQREPGVFVLDPLETRSFSLLLLNPGVLSGLLLNREGAPIAGQEIWLVQGAEHARYFTCADRTDVFSFTDERGAFFFSDVPQGDYLVGACPPCPPTASDFRATENKREAATLGWPVRVLAEVTTPIELRVDTQLFLRGVVVDGRGRRVPEPTLEVSSEDWMGPIPAQTDGQGRFHVGPLQRGQYGLHASLLDPVMRSRRVVVPAGEEELELELEPVRGSIQGRVRDAARGTGRPALVHLLRVGAAPGTILRPAAGAVPVDRVYAQGGHFEFSGLAPGEYGLVALTPKSRPPRFSAPQRVGLTARNGEVRGVTLVLGPSGVLHLSLGGDAAQHPGRWPVEVWAEGLFIKQEWLTPGRETKLPVPAGRLTLIAYDARRGRLEGPVLGRTIELQPGEERTLRLGE